MKKLSLILFSILMIFSMNVSVFAGSVIHEGTPGSGKNVSGGSKRPNRFDTYPSGEDVFRAIRVSFVKSDGTDLFVQDYAIDKQYTAIDTRHSSYYYANSKCSKVAHANNKCGTLNWKKTNSDGLQARMSTISNLSNIFSKHNFSIGNNFVDYLTNSNLMNFATATSNWLSQSSYTGQKYEEDLAALLKEFVSESYLSVGEIERIFIVIEPVTIVTLHDSHFYASTYELSSLADSYAEYKNDYVYVGEGQGNYKKNGDKWEKVGDKKGDYKLNYKINNSKDALDSNVSPYLRKNFPCGSYLTNNLYTKIEKLYGNIEGFSSTKYFNTIEINTTYQSTCNSTKSLTKAQVTGNYGVGMAVIWIYEFYQPKKEVPTCQVVHNVAGYSNTPVGSLTCDAVTKIVDDFNAKAEQNNYSKITVEWYKTNCGCNEQTNNGYNCTPNYQVGKCSNSTQINYSDLIINNDIKTEEDFWQYCVYDTGVYKDLDVHKTNTNGAYSYIDNNLTGGINRYCEVRCIENVQTDFKTSSTSDVYQAGTYLTWPNGTTVTGSRTCRATITKDSWNKYKSDLATDPNNAQSYINQMKSCYTWAMNETGNADKIYNLNPIVELDTVNTGYTIPADLRKLTSSKVYTYFNSFDPTDSCVANYDNGQLVYNCSTISDKDSLVEATVGKKVSYTLSDKLYRYISKADNLSSITIPTGSYIYMSYGNIPIAYNIKDGIYDISFNYSKLGHMDNSANNYSAIDKILQNIDSDNYGKWECQYSINSKLIPEKTNNSGIDVIYRPIDLNNPFPDIDGNGRLVGSNWCDGTNCNNNNDLIKRVITENELPDTPMYSFILTPTVIQQIRKYNSNNKYDDFNLECELSTGRACVSEFLTSLIQGNLNNSSFNSQPSGTCVNNPLSRVTNSAYFYGC